MAYTEEQTKLFTNKYSPKWNAQLQQTANVLRNYVTVLTGLRDKQVRLKKIGLRTMSQYTDGREATTSTDSKTEARILTFKKYKDNETIDPDMELSINDADGYIAAVMDGMKAGAERQMELEMIDAMIGDTLILGDNGATTGTALPSTQIIPVDYVRTGTAVESALTFDKIRAAKAKLSKSQAYKKGETLCLALSEEQMMELLGDERATSSLFQKTQALIDGEIDTFMGFKILRTEQLPIAAGTRSVLAWVKSGVQVGIWRDAKFELFNRTEKSNAPHIMVKMAAGGGRLHEESVVKILCKE